MVRARVKTSLNRRSSPAVSGNRIGVYRPDTIVTIVSEFANWALVTEQYPGDISQLCWVSLVYLEKIVSQEVNTPFVFTAWPTDHKVITQDFGARPEYYKKFGWIGGHEGIDIMAPLNAPYYAAAAGTVTKISNLRSDGKPSAYGWYIVIDHTDGYSSLYAHAQDDWFPVAVGTEVKAGEIIGYSGNTGNSDGAHLHLTLKKVGAQTPGFPAGYVDPTPFIKWLIRGGG